MDMFTRAVTQPLLELVQARDARAEQLKPSCTPT
jgi:hypothetical protein